MNLLIMGPPGAGKGSQAELIIKEFKIAHISTGDMFREAIANKTEVGVKVKAILDRGELVNDDLTCELVKERLQKPDTSNGFMLDGFPRTIEQAKKLDVILKELSLKLNKVINMEVDFSLIEKRIVGRRICKDCGATFHTTNKPPLKENICDVCNGELYQRKDDNKETINNRLSVYSNQTKPILDYYEDRDIILNVDASNSIDSVFEIIKKELKD